MRVRVERDLRTAFVAACQAANRPAAQVLREFMRHYVIESTNIMKKDGRRVSRTKRRICNE